MCMYKCVGMRPRAWQQRANVVRERAEDGGREGKRKAVEEDVQHDGEQDGREGAE